MWLSLILKRIGEIYGVDELRVQGELIVECAGGSLRQICFRVIRVICVVHAMMILFVQS